MVIYVYREYISSLRWWSVEKAILWPVMSEIKYVFLQSPPIMQKFKLWRHSLVKCIDDVTVKCIDDVAGVEMAVKRMIVTVDDRERKTLQMDVTVIMKAECPYIVKFYGALFREGEVRARVTWFGTSHVIWHKSRDLAQCTWFTPHFIVGGVMVSL